MFNVNPTRMWRNKTKGKKKEHRTRHFNPKFEVTLFNKRISLRKKPTRNPTHKASAKRRAKALRKARMFGLGWIGTTTRGKNG